MNPEDEKITIVNPIVVDRTITPEELDKLQYDLAEKVAEAYLKDHPEGDKENPDITPF